MNTEKENQDFLNSKEAASYLRISMPKLYEAIKNENMPYHKIGEKFLFYREELKKWLLAQ